MKKFSILILMTILFLASCSKKDDVNLSNITCDEIKIGDAIDTIDLTYYTTTERLKNSVYTLNFEELRIATDSNNMITKIHATMSSVNVLIHSKTCSEKNDIIELLGNNYKNKTYDFSQRLNELLYVDKLNSLKASFVYSTLDNKLVWMILEKTN